ncbi:MAG TPA: hypothetical protein PLH11_05110 [Gemmobacter sp.]|mgnify:CR=1 FL=1|nr:hypothetical protein [Gemmobacter sp.]
MLKLSGLGLVFALLSMTSAGAGVCDYRLSQLAGSGTATAVSAGSAGMATAGPTAMAVGGLYFIPHGTSGTLMLGSTLAGSSAAGTVGIIGGSGFAASVLAFLTAPVTLIVAGGTTVAAGGMEAGCYFADERITEYAKVFHILRRVSETANHDYFEVIDSGTTVRIRDKDGVPQYYKMHDLYIVNGELMHRDSFLNTSLGNLAASVYQQP